MKRVFKEFQKVQTTEMRPVDEEDFEVYGQEGVLLASVGKANIIVSISEPDLENGSPKVGDMIARNKENHFDQWLVAEEYFKANYTPF